MGEGLSGVIFDLIAFGEGNERTLYISGALDSDQEVARWNGSEWEDFSHNLTGTVDALAEFDDGTGPALYAAGRFSVDGTANVAKWNGTQWVPVGLGVAFEVRDILVVDDGGPQELYLAGVGGRVARWTPVGWEAVGSGMNDHVNALASVEGSSGRTLYAGGSFTGTNSGISTLSVAQLTDGGWSQLANYTGDGIPGATGTVYDLSMAQGKPYLGGQFHLPGFLSKSILASFDRTAWSEVAAFSGNFFSRALVDNSQGDQVEIFVGGTINPLNHIGVWAGTTWSSVGGGMNNIVHALEISDDGNILYAGGYFTSAGGAPANYVAQWDGASWSALGLGMSNAVDALLVDGDHLYAGGRFTHADGIEVNHVAQWDGSQWNPLGPGLTQRVYALAIYDVGNGPELYAATARGLARWDGTSWSDFGNGITQPVFSLEVYNDGTGPALFIGGDFQSAGGISVNQIVKWNGSWQSLDGGLDNTVRALTASEGDESALYAGGTFSLAGGYPSSLFAKWTCAEAPPPPPPPPADSPDLSLSILDRTPEVIAGGQWIYEIIVDNRVPGVSATATVTHGFPDGLTCQWQSTTTGGVSGNTPGMDSPINDTLDMDVGSSVTYDVLCDVAEDASGQITINANVTAFGDRNPGNNTASITRSISSRPVRTILLTNLARMESLAGWDITDLAVKLQELAAHPKVQGLVIDLGNDASLNAAYEAWDENVEQAQETGVIPDPDLANEILFGPDGAHAKILELVRNHPGTEYLMLIGDDRIIPMARLRDFTSDYPEREYAYGLDPGIDALNTTVGQALSRNRYLSDDALAYPRTFDPSELGDLFDPLLPGRPIGRLVETPQEIIAAIDGYLSQDGLLDLGALDPAYRALVTGYDFLVDSARGNRRMLNRCPGQANGDLISTSWTGNVEENRDLLASYLADPYGLVNLNGHATHYEEGVPSNNFMDIQGVSTERLSTLDFTGRVLYAVGCHGGLPVAGSDATEDHPQDLPQTYLSRGASAYIANSGYGWGLQPGIGYSERMVQILTEEFVKPETTAVGQAFRNAKERYHSELAGQPDAYDVKTSMQWTLFGFPMYEVVVPCATPAASQPELADTKNGVVVEYQGPTVIEHRLQSGSTTPTFVLPLTMSFDFSGTGVYQKYNSGGEPIDTPGCDDPDGCYYTLSQLVERVTGEHGFSAEPYAATKVSFPNTSLHGVLWKGASYSDDKDWIPLFAQRISNGGFGEMSSPLPRSRFVLPRGPRRGLNNPDDCRGVDLEENTIVFGTGELRRDAEDGWIERLHQDEELELFYYNNLEFPQANCDREGPEFLPGIYHDVSDGNFHWNVPVNNDDQDVWRVVVVWNDGINQRWTPVELAHSNDGHWTGTQFVGTAYSRMEYYVQAVDLKGNVSWLNFNPLNPSGASSEEPFLVEVAIDSGEADLQIEWQLDSNTTSVDSLFIAPLQITNLGNGFSDPITVTVPLDGEIGWEQELDETDWTCEVVNRQAECRHFGLPVGPAAPLRLLLTSPADVGSVSLSAHVTADNDPFPTNNTAATTLIVTDTSGPLDEADLAVSLAIQPSSVKPFKPLEYSLTVLNLGPGTASDLTVRTMLPPGVLAGFASGNGWSCDVSGGEVECHRDALAVGWAPVIAVITSSPGTAATFNIAAEVTSANDPTTVNNTAEALFDVAERLPTLRVEQPLAAPSGDFVDVPIKLETDGASISGLAFSIDFDENCLIFDPADHDGDGIPDALDLAPIEDGYSHDVSFSAADMDGEIDIILWDWTPSAPLNNEIATLTFQVSCTPNPGQTYEARVGFSSEPSPSASDPQALRVPITHQDGVINITDGLRGDCNSDSLVEVSDLNAVGLEIFDGDGNFWLDVPLPTYPGSPAGCDCNADTTVDAGDSSCIVNRIFGNFSQSNPAMEEIAEAPQLTLPLRVTANGDRVVIPVSFSSGGHAVSSVAFSLDLDPSLIADIVTYQVPGEVTGNFQSVEINPDGGLNVLMSDISETPQALPDGVILEIELNVPGATTLLERVLRFSSSLRASFGTTDGRSIPGTADFDQPEMIFSNGFESGDASNWEVIQ